MDGSLVHGGIGLERGTLARIEDGKGTLVRVRDGEVWITQAGDCRDYFLRGGEHFRLDRDGLALISALTAARVTITAPASATAAL